jgi:hypothetical protein
MMPSYPTPSCVRFGQAYIPIRGEDGKLVQQIPVTRSGKTVRAYAVEGTSKPDPGEQSHTGDVSIITQYIPRKRLVKTSLTIQQNTDNGPLSADSLLNGQGRQSLMPVGLSPKHAHDDRKPSVQRVSYITHSHRADSWRCFVRPDSWATSVQRTDTLQHNWTKIMAADPAAAPRIFSDLLRHLRLTKRALGEKLPAEQKKPLFDTSLWGTDLQKDIKARLAKLPPLLIPQAPAKPRPRKQNR